MSLLDKLIPKVYAHCDLPCGIYETDTLRHAADTCLKMIERYEQLGEVDSAEKQNSFIRIVAIKEKHAEVFKDQVSILWTDYFKPEHLERFPDLHETMWMAAKQASHVKQSLSRDEAQKLVEQAGKIAELFADSKADSSH